MVGLVDSIDLTGLQRELAEVVELHKLFDVAEPLGLRSQTMEDRRIFEEVLLDLASVSTKPRSSLFSRNIIVSCLFKIIQITYRPVGSDGYDITYAYSKLNNFLIMSGAGQLKGIKKYLPYFNQEIFNHICTDRDAAEVVSRKGVSYSEYLGYIFKMLHSYPDLQNEFLEDVILLYPDHGMAIVTTAIEVHSQYPDFVSEFLLYIAEHPEDASVVATYYGKLRKADFIPDKFCDFAIDRLGLIKEIYCICDNLHKVGMLGALADEIYTEITADPSKVVPLYNNICILLEDADGKSIRGGSTFSWALFCFYNKETSKELSISPLYKNLAELNQAAKVSSERVKMKQLSQVVPENKEPMNAEQILMGFK